MAVTDKNGKYLKVCVERCFADVNGFHIAYEVHNSSSIRAIEKEREDKVRLLEEKVNELYAEYIKEINEYSSKKGIKLPDESERLPENLREKLEVASTIFRDLNRVKLGIYNRGEQQILPINMEILLSLGLEPDWFERGVENPINIIEISSPYNRQRFDYPTAYSELKKILKDGFKDC